MRFPALALTAFLSLHLFAADVPRMNGITIDGDAADWKDHGLRIDALAPVDGRVVPTTDFDATVRLAWGDTADHAGGPSGLLVLFSVVDRTIVESDADNYALAHGDSVELFVASFGVTFARYVISPGVDPKHPQLRQWSTNPDPDKQVRAAARKTAAGYRVELFLPVREIGLGPDTRDGSTFFINVAVNDRDSRTSTARRHTLMPLGPREFEWGRALRVQFATRAGPPITTAVAATVVDARRHLITIVTTSEHAGQSVEVGHGPPLHDLVGATTRPAASNPADAAPVHPSLLMPIAQERVHLTADRYAATVSVPLPPLTPAKPPNPIPPILTTPAPFYVYLDSTRIAEIPMPAEDLDRQRRHALAQLDVVFRPGVFAGDAFPPCDFSDPAAARELLGQPYTLQPTFYDAQYNEVTKPEKPGRYAAVVRIQTENLQFPLRLVTMYKAKSDAEWGQEQLKPQLALPPELGLNPEVVRQHQFAVAEIASDVLSEHLSKSPDLPLLVAALADAKPGGPRFAGRYSIWAEDQRWWFPLKQKLGIARYKYLVDEPVGTDEDKGAHPVLLVLHGSGERGDDLEEVRVNGPAKTLEATQRQDPRRRFLIVSPQCPSGEWWSAQQLDLLLREVQSKYPVDPDRIYVTGLSMGGYGTWELAAEYPDRFAAIAPICGAGNPDDADRLKHLPVWMFHGEKDSVVPFARSTEMYDALRRVGGRVRFSPYPDRGHDAWSPTYVNPELYTWLLAQKRGAPSQPSATP